MTYQSSTARAFFTGPNLPLKEPTSNPTIGKKPSGRLPAEAEEVLYCGERRLRLRGEGERFAAFPVNQREFYAGRPGVFWFVTKPALGPLALIQVTE